MKVPQITRMSCTLACFESFSAQNGGTWTQRAIISNFPALCQGNQPEPGYVLTEGYVELAGLLGIHCEPIPNPPLPLPRYPTQAILIGAGNFEGSQHSLLWIRALPGDRGIAMNPNPAVTHYRRFRIQQLAEWESFCWLLRV
jgi:hypothetical protein